MGVHAIEVSEVCLDISGIALILQWGAVSNVAFWGSNWCASEGGNALCNFVSVATNKVNLWVEHFVNSNEVGPVTFQCTCFKMR